MTATQGTVVAFDEAKGWGTVRDAGGTEHFFHCTAIADGSRTVDLGTSVRYDVVPGHLGQWEAASLEPV